MLPPFRLWVDNAAAHSLSHIVLGDDCRARPGKVFIASGVVAMDVGVDHEANRSGVDSFDGIGNARG